MADRLIIFDTTLRDGEQAPGFSMRIDEKLRLARQLETLGVDIIEAGFPIASEADAEAVRRVVAGPVHRPIVAALARCAPGDIDRAAWALAPAPRGRIHTFIATSDLHLERQAAHDARGVPRRRDGRRSRARARTPTTWSSRRRTRRGATSTSCAGSSRRVIDAGRDDDQPAGHGRLLDAGRDRASSSGPSSRACRTPTASIFSAHCHDDLGLAVANTLAAIGARRAPGRVHDQRHRRARRQRVARRDRDGDPRARRSPARRDRHRRREQLFASSQLLTDAHRRARPGQQGDRRPQRVRARGRHPPGRHAEGSPHLRNHAAGGRGRAADDARARQALGPSRRAEALRAARPDARRARTSTRSTARMIALADREKHVTDDDLRSGRDHDGTSCGVRRRARLDATPAEAGYGFGV